MPDGAVPPEARYSIVISSPDGVGDDASPAGALVIWLDDDGIVGFDAGCDGQPVLLVDLLGRVPLGETAPTPTPLATPPAGLTGVASVDAAIMAIRNRDVDALLAQVVYTGLPCVENPHDLDPGPYCGANETGGTVVASWFVGICEGAWMPPSQVPITLSNALLGRIVKMTAYRDVRDQNVPNARYRILWDAIRSSGDEAGEALVLDDRGIIGFEACGPPTPGYDPPPGGIPISLA